MGRRGDAGMRRRGDAGMSASFSHFSLVILFDEPPSLRRQILCGMLPFVTNRALFITH